MAFTARVGDITAHPGGPTGIIITGSPTRIGDGLPIARMGDVAVCNAHGPQAIVTASADVLLDGLGVARVGDAIGCGAVIITGSSDILTDT